ncbi:MAG: hypothetical protein HOW73_50545 [Polyangiaceae bacterium]|nr:hypothetical protein [Polyangiaceae bacterium]
MAKARTARSLRDKINAELDKVTLQGINNKRVDLEALKRRDTPLARVIGEFIPGSTYRDNPDDLAQKIELVLTARDDTSALAKALDDLKKTLK